MTELEIEQRLRGFYRAEVGYTELAPVTLRGRLEDIPAVSGRFGLGLSRRHRRAIALALLVATLATAGALLVLSQPKPQPEPLPPSSVTLWMVLQNERPGLVEYRVSSGSADGGNGMFVGCVSGLTSFTMTTPWTLYVDGQPAVTSDQRSAAYTGLSNGGDVTVRIVALEDGTLEVAPLEQGSAMGTASTTPESCAWYAEPPANVDIPAELEAFWLTQVPASASIGPANYRVHLNAGLVVPASNGWEAPRYLQGQITAITGTDITFGPSPECAGSGVYRWEMTDGGSILRLDAVDDSCKERRELFADALERQLDAPFIANVRYVTRNFGRPLSLAFPQELAVEPDAKDGQSTVADGYFYYRIPGLGIEMSNTFNTTPAACLGPEGWLTGGAAYDAASGGPVIPTTSLDEFRTAFAAWDLAHAAVTVTEPRDLTIAGRPAMVVDVIAGATCGESEPGLQAGDILERDYAIDFGVHVLIVAAGPGVFAEEGWSTDGYVHQPQTYDPTVFDIADRFVQSFELP